jgi:hypothetical protein
MDKRGRPRERAEPAPMKGNASAARLGEETYLTTFPSASYR